MVTLGKLATFHLAENTNYPRRYRGNIDGG
ncbi:hypothetical protein J2Z50_000717 [Ensifer mexicanus]|nr:hypothetical protein [Sinorhizobium mexicanum]